MKHPVIGQLALYSGGDVPLAGRLRLMLHLRRCERCRNEVEALREARLELKDGASAMPAQVNWERLSAEMRANIRLGLTAGAIVNQTVITREALEPHGWRLAAICASLCFVLATGWWLDRSAVVRQAPEAVATSAAQAVTDASLDRRRTATFTLLNPSEQPVTTTVSWDGDVRSRYVDSETGQVTIQHVYGQ